MQIINGRIGKLSKMNMKDSGGGWEAERKLYPFKLSTYLYTLEQSPPV